MTFPHDPTKGLDYIDAAGHRRYLACLPPRPDHGLPRFRSAYPTIPRDQWREVSYRHLSGPILDQDGFGACVGFGSTTAFTVAWGLAGATPRAFSAWQLYGNVNGGVDQGAIVSDAIEVLANVGICLLSTVGEGQIYKRRYPPEAAVEAKRFRAASFHGCETFDEIGAALLLGAVGVSFGIEIGSAFRPDARGVVPAKRGSGGGHCMAALGLAMIDGQWHIETQNSWGEDWGKAGVCYLPESYFKNQRWPVDAWAIHAVREDPQEPIVPPVGA